MRTAPPSRLLATPLAAATLLAAALVVAALVAALAAPASASAAGPRIVSPAPNSVVTGKLRYAVAASSARRVAFYVDGRRRAVRKPRRALAAHASTRRKRARSTRFQRAIVLPTAGLRAGRHRLVVVQRDRRGRLRRDRRWVRVARSGGVTVRTPAADAEQRPAPASATWSAGFEGGDFGEWSWYLRDDGGDFYAATAASQGIPAHGGQGVARFEVTAEQAASGQTHSKLFKNWAIGGRELDWDDDDGRLLERLPNGSPSGTYSAWYYLPADYRADRSWANVFQFKESYVDGAGRWQQDPQWWVNLTPARAWSADVRPAGVAGDDPVLAVSNWAQRQDGPWQVVAAPRGRWFEIRAVVEPGAGIDWYVDGTHWQRSSAATYPVGVSRANPNGWIFGVGHYGGVGRLWVDDVAFAAS